MTLEPKYITGELFTRSSESKRLSQLWQQLSPETRLEIERRAKANGLSLIDQLRFSLPAVVQSEESAPVEVHKMTPTMTELIHALNELIELMKRT